MNTHTSCVSSSKAFLWDIIQGFRKLNDSKNLLARLFGYVKELLRTRYVKRHESALNFPSPAYYPIRHLSLPESLLSFSNGNVLSDLVHCTWPVVLMETSILPGNLAPVIRPENERYALVSFIRHALLF